MEEIDDYLKNNEFLEFILKACNFYINNKEPTDSEEKILNKLIAIQKSEVANKSNNSKFLELFDIFIKTYPTRTPDGRRILSPASSTSMLGIKMFKKLKSITKGDLNYMNEIINSLNDEIIHRKNNGSLNYMKSIEAWINNGGWENSYENNKAIPTGSAIGKAI